MNPAFIRFAPTLLAITCGLVLTACRTPGIKKVESEPTPTPVDQAEKGRTKPARNERTEPRDPRVGAAPVTPPVAPPTKAPPASQPPIIATTPVPAPIPSPAAPGKTPPDVTTVSAPRNSAPNDLPATPAPIVQPPVPAPLPGTLPGGAKVNGNSSPDPKASLPVTINSTPGTPLPGRPPEVLSLPRATPSAPEPIRSVGANERAISLDVSSKAPPGGTAGSVPVTTGPSLSRIPGFEDRPAPAGSRGLSLPAFLGGSIAGPPPAPPASLSLPSRPDAGSGRETINTNMPAGNLKTLGFDPLLQERKPGETWREQQLQKKTAEQKAREEEQQKLKDALHRFLFKDGTNR